ncbi:MAG: restriction endonuclease subunit S [Casimicrobiaceae bacterium]
MSLRFDRVRVGDLAHIEMGQSPDSTRVFYGQEAGLPFLQGNAEFGPQNPEPRFSCTRPLKKCRAGDLLISVRAPVGEINIADRNYCIGRGLAVIRLHGVEPVLAAEIVKTAAPSLRRVAQGTTFEAISKADLQSLVIDVPPVLERPVIQAVIEALTTTIRQTEAIIEKLKLVKQGLLHDLLSHGVDANGELRPPQNQAPHLYKESTLGWIPKEWLVGPVERFLGGVIDYRGKTPTKANVGTPLITAKNVRLGYIDPEPREFISDRSFEQWMTRGIPKMGDVLFTTEAPLGNVAQIDTEGRLAFAQRIIILQSNELLIGAYLKYLLLGEEFRRRLFATGSGSTVEGIKQSTFRKLTIAVPTDRNEQRFVIKRLAEADLHMKGEGANSDKLRFMKAGLSDDILTGRVRVTPLLT